MRGLVEELGLAASCTIEKVDAAKLVDDVLSADSGRSKSLETLKLLRTHMAVRAMNNLAFFRMFHPDK